MLPVSDLLCSRCPLCDMPISFKRTITKPEVEGDSDDVFLLMWVKGVAHMGLDAERIQL